MEEDYLDFVGALSGVISRSEEMILGALMFLFVFIVAYAISQVVRKLTRKYLLAKLSKREVATFLSDLLFYAFMIIGLTVALSTVGVNVNAIIASLGLGGFAIGFALKDVISNFTSGLLILLTKTFEAGDWVKVSNFEGRVKSINLRHTVVAREESAAEAEKVLIPNSIIFSAITVVRKPSKQII